MDPVVFKVNDFEIVDRNLMVTQPNEIPQIDPTEKSSFDWKNRPDSWVAHVFGTTPAPEGKVIMAEIVVRPFFYISIPEEWKSQECDIFTRYLMNRLHLPENSIQFRLDERAYVYGFHPDPKTKGQTRKNWSLMMISFSTYWMLKAVSRLISTQLLSVPLSGKYLKDSQKENKDGTVTIRSHRNEPLLCDEQQFTGYHDNFSPELIFHICTGIVPSSFVQVNKYHVLEMLPSATSTTTSSLPNPLSSTSFPKPLENKSTPDRTTPIATSWIKNIYPSKRSFLALRTNVADLVTNLGKHKHQACDRMASVDLECVSASYRFPNPMHLDDYIIMIGTSVYTSGLPVPSVAATDAKKTTADAKKTNPKYNPGTFDRHIFYITKHPRADEVRNKRAAKLKRIEDVLLLAEQKKKTGKENKSTPSVCTQADEKKKKQEALQAHEMKRIEEEDQSEQLKELHFHAFETEIEMIRAWKIWFDEMDPDIIVGHNIHKFDFKYLFYRVSKHNPNEVKTIFRFSRYANVYTPLVTSSFQSSAFKCTNQYKFDTTGRLQIDSFTYVFRTFTNLSSYKLGEICKGFFGIDKMDVSPFQIFDFFLSSDDKWIRRIGRYCARDCDLVIDLLCHIKSVPSLSQMSQVCFTRFQNILDKGQQEKMYNLIANHAHHNKFVINYKKALAQQLNNETISSGSATYQKDPNSNIRRLVHNASIAQRNAKRQKVESNQDATTEDLLNEDVSIVDSDDDDDIELGGDEDVSTNDDDDDDDDNADEETMDSDQFVFYKFGKKPASTDGHATRKNDDKIMGATVFEPKVAFYNKTPVGVLDFSSMYPWAIMANNLCPSTWVENPTPDQLRGINNPKVDHPDVQYKVTEISPNPVSSTGNLTTLQKKQNKMISANAGIMAMLQSQNKIKTQTKKEEIAPERADIFDTGKERYVFVQHVRGIFPTLERTLLDERIAIRKTMKTMDSSSSDYMLNDCRQNVIKITCNSLYGFSASLKQGRLPCKAVGASTTAESRQLIDFTKNIVQSDEFNMLVIYGDTDSIMIISKDPTMTLERMGKICTAISERITFLKKGKAELTFEKIYFPYLLQKKKKYAGRKYTLNTKTNEMQIEKKMDARGLENVRRDYPQKLRALMSGTLDVICETSNLERAMEYVEQYVIQPLMKHEFEVNDFITTRSLSPSYDNPTAQIAWHVKEKTKKRMPGSEPESGDRVPYVMVLTEKCTTVMRKVTDFTKSDGKRATMKKGWDNVASQADDPEYVKRSGIPLDMVYYLNLFRRPLCRLFETSPEHHQKIQQKFNLAERALDMWCRQEIKKRHLNTVF